MSEVDSLRALFEPCKCKTKYTIEPHGAGYALYAGRCPHRHGYNLVNMIEPAANFDVEFIEKLLQLGHEQYLNQGSRFL